VLLADQLVDQRDGLANGKTLVVRDADVGQDKELKDHVVVAPDRADLIFGPAAAMARHDLIVADMLEGPFMRFEIGRQHIDRLGFLFADGKFAVDHVKSASVHILRGDPSPGPTNSLS